MRVSKPLWKKAVGIVAILFGLLTLVSGGRLLFGGDAAKAAAGNTVDFVLWFNFLSGAFYVFAGIGIYIGKAWAVLLSNLLAVAVSIVLILFVQHVYSGGEFEIRTVAAMILRATFWIATAIALNRSLKLT